MFYWDIPALFYYLPVAGHSSSTITLIEAHYITVAVDAVRLFSESPTLEKRQTKDTIISQYKVWPGANICYVQSQWQVK